MQYLYRVEIADFMTIQECAYWLAFGRLNERMESLVEDGPLVDERRSVERILELGQNPAQPELFFERASLKRLLPNLDYDEYFRCYMICFGESPESLLHKQEYLRNVVDTVTINRTEEQLAIIRSRDDDDEIKMNAAISLDRALKPLRVMLERAQAEVFLALADGRIDSWGVFELATEDEHTEDVEPTALVRVPSDAWSSSKIDWDNPSLSTWDGAYLAVTVDTASFLSLFPQPRITGTPVSGLLFGETLLIPDGETRPEIPISIAGRRGAPSAETKLIRDALEREFTALKFAGKLPEKREAQIALAQEFVWNRLGGEISRSTVQRYIDTFNGSKSGDAALKAAQKSAQNS